MHLTHYTRIECQNAARTQSTAEFLHSFRPNEIRRIINKWCLEWTLYCNFIYLTIVLMNSVVSSLNRFPLWSYIRDFHGYPAHVIVPIQSVYWFGSYKFTSNAYVYWSSKSIALHIRHIVLNMNRIKCSLVMFRSLSALANRNISLMTDYYNKINIYRYA